LKFKGRAPAATVHTGRLIKWSEVVVFAVPFHPVLCVIEPGFVKRVKHGATSVS